MKLSVVVVAYDMARELPRTMRSLSPAMQRDIEPDDYEIIVVDNGSPRPLDADALAQWGGHVRLHRIADAPPSPVRAINEGLAMARGDLVGVCIDGARMASPRLLATALEAARLHPRPVIGTLAFHLGPDVQRRSVAAGYCQAVEDRLLEEAGWQEDGYRLFGISVFAGSSAGGWFQMPAETNALFLTRQHWQALGGYDPGFVAPGGGLANLDIWVRACGDPAAQVVLLLGEGTFHQVHGGLTTNAAVSRWPEFHAEYVALRGHDYLRPQRQPLLVGRLHPAAAASVVASVAKLGNA